MFQSASWQQFGAAWVSALDGSRVTFLGLLGFAWLLSIERVQELRLWRLVPALLLSLLCIDTVSHPILLADGLRDDLRRPLVMLGAMFLGWPASLAPLLVTAGVVAARAAGNMAGGLLDVAIAYGIGLGLRELAKRGYREVGLREAFFGGLAMPLAYLGRGLLPAAGGAMARSLAPLVAISVVGCLTFGLVLDLLLRPARAETALKQSEARLRQLVDGSTQGIVIVDGSRPLFANRTFAAMFGFRSTEAVLALPSLDPLFGPSLVSIVPPAAARPGGEAPLHVRKYPASRSDGAPVWIDFEVRRTDWGGRPVLLVTTIDVTELKEAEDRLAERQAALVEHQQSILELGRLDFCQCRTMEAAAREIVVIAARAMGTARAVIWVVDNESGVRRTLAAWDARRRRYYEAVFREAPVDAEVMRRVADNEIGVHEDVADEPDLPPLLREHLAAGGVTALLAVPFHTDSRYSGVVSFSEEAGPRRFTVEEQILGRNIANLSGLALLTVQHQHALAALDAASQGIYIRDAVGDVTYANARARDLVGIGPDDPLDRDISVALPAGPDGMAEQTQTVDLSWEALDGSKTVLALSSSRLPDGGTLVLFQDVSEERRLDNEHRALEAQLLRASKMEAVGRLAGGIAHEFNNLLGSLFGYAGFLIEDLPEGSPQHRYAERINTVCHRAKDLVRQVLAFSRTTDAGHARFDAREMLHEGEEILRATLPVSTRLDFRLGTEPVWILGNAGQFSQILVNLCINANDAIDGIEGIVTVTLRVRTASSPWVPASAEAMPDETVRAGALVPGTRYALLSVQDNGKGMSKETLGRVFEPFFTTKERGRGTGLGLAVVHGLVLDHKGAYCVTSRHGWGTLFDLYFPLSDAPGAVVPSIAEPPAPIGCERVLIVDDEVELTDVVRAGLIRLGYEVACVDDPVAALEVLRQEDRVFDALITDEVLPKIKGINLIPKIKTAYPGLKIILWTGFSDGVDEQSALAAGADLFLHKPVEPRALADNLRRLFASS